MKEKQRLKHQKTVDKAVLFFFLIPILLLEKLAFPFPFHFGLAFSLTLNGTLGVSLTQIDDEKYTRYYGTQSLRLTKPKYIFAMSLRNA